MKKQPEKIPEDQLVAIVTLVCRNLDKEIEKFHIDDQKLFRYYIYVHYKGYVDKEAL